MVWVEPRSEDVTVQESAEAGAVPETSGASSAPAAASMAISVGRWISDALVLAPTWSCALRCVNERTLLAREATDCLPGLQFRTTHNRSLNLYLSITPVLHAPTNRSKCTRPTYVR